MLTIILVNASLVETAVFADNFSANYIRASPKTKVLCETLEHPAACESGEPLENGLSRSENSLLLVSFAIAWVRAVSSLSGA